jgi:hypothetical protein
VRPENTTCRKREKIIHATRGGEMAAEMKRMENCNKMMESMMQQKPAPAIFQAALDTRKRLRFRFRPSTVAA